MGAIELFELSHFKAFKDDIKFDFKGKHALIFGENGSGKTSFFEALKMAFYHERLEATKVFASDTPEDAHEKRRQLYESYRNANAKDRFSININGKDYTTLARDDYKVFLVTHDDFNLKDDCILLEEILGRLFFDYGEITPKELMQTICDDLEVAVNRSLKEQFSESVIITLDKGDRCRCVLSDLEGHLKYGTNLSHYFNEGKIHLILIIIYINAFLLLADKKNNILVLDDIITSLDATNRAYVLRFLFDSLKPQKSLQVFLLTHNVSFYNLTKHYINNYLEPADVRNWTFFNIYNLGSSHKLYAQDDDKIDRIEADLQSGSVALESLGNRIRQIFEIQVHELSKIIISGGLEESRDILARLAKGDPVYYNGGKNVYDLVKELEDTAQKTTLDRAQLSKKILDTIKKYRNDPELKNIREVLRNMTLFQKISLHPTSHGTLGLAPVSQKEMKESMQLVKKIGACIDKLKDKNLINM